VNKYDLTVSLILVVTFKNSLQGQFFSVEQTVIYLLGNPLIWWGHCLFFLVYFALWIINAVAMKRGVKLSENQQCKLHIIKPPDILSVLILSIFLCILGLRTRTLGACGWLYVGFFLHYAPFWPMTRILYVHHYYPALLFSNMISGNLTIIFVYCLLLRNRFFRI
jgi:dolichyl-phosphate-mannose-protein mannosyltransferase